MGTEGLVHVVLGNNNIEYLVVSVHIEMSLSQDRSKARMSLVKK